jgi:hypothetical protein
MGHGLYGFCHIDGFAGQLSIMGIISPTAGLGEADIVASRAVYTAGLRPGATRGQFQAAGLIK